MLQVGLHGGSAVKGCRAVFRRRALGHTFKVIVKYKVQVGWLVQLEKETVSINAIANLIRPTHMCFGKRPDCNKMPTYPSQPENH